MTESINFPNLGIHLEHVGQKISIFGFDIAYYGMIIGIGILAGVLMAVKALFCNTRRYNYRAYRCSGRDRGGPARRGPC